MIPRLVGGTVLLEVDTWNYKTNDLIEPHGGQVVAEFFDIGQSRSLPWKRRPEANGLLEALKHPDRGFDAVREVRRIPPEEFATAR